MRLKAGIHVSVARNFNGTAEESNSSMDVEEEGEEETRQLRFNASVLQKAAAGSSSGQKRGASLEEASARKNRRLAPQRAQSSEGAPVEGHSSQDLPQQPQQLQPPKQPRLPESGGKAEEEDVVVVEKPSSPVEGHSSQELPQQPQEETSHQLQPPKQSRLPESKGKAEEEDVVVVEKPSSDNPFAAPRAPSSKPGMKRIENALTWHLARLSQWVELIPSALKELQERQAKEKAEMEKLLAELQKRETELQEQEKNLKKACRARAEENKAFKAKLSSQEVSIRALKEKTKTQGVELAVTHQQLKSADEELRRAKAELREMEEKMPSMLQKTKEGAVQEYLDNPARVEEEAQIGILSFVEGFKACQFRLQRTFPRLKELPQILKWSARNIPEGFKINMPDFPDLEPVPLPPS